MLTASEEGRRLRKRIGVPENAEGLEEAEQLEDAEGLHDAHNLWAVRCDSGCLSQNEEHWASDVRMQDG